ncbi:nectin-4-like [Scomber scombrus]|uniref:nectin-4-like n=1 Tax=Scomber scombrus TaxID=13677 RepID=UPI002DD7D588|nr:nectin-4-like [Scomber scombrus]
MAAITPAHLCVTLLIYMWAFAPISSSEDILKVKVMPGGDARLQCRGDTEDVIMLQWGRSDLNKGDYVFFFRENRPYESLQYPSFRGRVQLMDPQMRNGNVSVILKNVTTNDTGTYECRVSTNGRRRRKRASKFTHRIQLTVTESDHVHERHSAGKTLTEEGKDEGVQDGGSKAGKVGAITSVALFVVFGVAFLLQQKRKLQAEQPAANEAEALNTGA